MSKPKEGDNVPAAARSLASFITRIENVEEEKKGLSDDIREIYGEAKSAGFDTKVMREIIKRRRKKKDEIEAFDAVLATYETNLDSVMD